MRELCSINPKSRPSFTKACEILKKADEDNKDLLAPLPIGMQPAALVEEGDQISESVEEDEEEAPAAPPNEAEDESGAAAAAMAMLAAPNQLKHADVGATIAGGFSCPNCSAVCTSQSPQLSRRAFSWLKL